MDSIGGRWTNFPAHDASDAFWGEWDELNGRLRGRHPFLDSRFVSALLQYWGTGTEQIIACHGDAGLTAAAVLQPARHGVWRTFLPSQTQLGPVLVGSHLAAREMLEAIPGFAVAIELLCQDPLYSPFGLPPEGGDVSISPYAPTMSLTLENGFEEYWQRRSRKLKNNVARWRKKAEGQGAAIKLTQISSVGQMREAVARYGELESRGWKGREGTALHEENPQGQFYSGIMERFGAEGNADVFELRVGGRLASSRLLIGNEEFRVALKTTYDEELPELAPGRLLLYEMLQKLAEGPGPKRLEFYTKATVDQLAWATEQRPIFHATLFRSAAFRLAAQVFRGIRDRFRGADQEGPLQDHPEA
jgi:hypothetical protein